MKIELRLITGPDIAIVKKTLDWPPALPFPVQGDSLVLEGDQMFHVDERSMDVDRLPMIVLYQHVKLNRGEDGKSFLEATYPGWEAR